MTANTEPVRKGIIVADESAISLADAVDLIRGHLGLLIVMPLVIGLAALGISFLITPTFTARTSFLPPQQQQSAAAAALASLGGLAALTGAQGTNSPAEQFVAFMRSATITNRLIGQFKLLDVYGVRVRAEARETLLLNTRMSLGRKDGLITVEVDDASPQRAADIANAYVGELAKLIGTLSLTEAQQRRAFFQRETELARDKLTAAQQALQSSGFNQSTLRAEPKAAADGFARLKAEVAATEVRLQVLRGSLSDNAPEVQQQLAALREQRSQLARLEGAPQDNGSPDYIGKYREFKYQEAMFEQMARQYELARVDESREGALVQVIDHATPPERKSKPKKAMIAVVAALATGLMLLVWLFFSLALRRSRQRRQQDHFSYAAEG